MRRVLRAVDRRRGRLRLLWSIIGPWRYARALYEDDAATLDDLRESVTTLEDTAQTARRVLGGAHPLVPDIEQALGDARAALRAIEETQPLED